MEIKLDASAMKDLVGEAIMASLTNEKREALIQSAVNYLLTKDTDPYGRVASSPIERAFREALMATAKEIATELLSKDQRPREVIRKLISDAVEKLLDDKSYNNTVERIQSAIAEGLAR